MHFFPFASCSCPFFFFAPFLCVVFRYACACVGVCACVQRFAVDGFNCAMMAAPCFSFLVFFFFLKTFCLASALKSFKQKPVAASQKKKRKPSAKLSEARRTDLRDAGNVLCVPLCFVIQFFLFFFFSLVMFAYANCTQISKKKKSQKGLQMQNVKKNAIFMGA